MKKKHILLILSAGVSLLALGSPAHAGYLEDPWCDILPW